MIMMMIKRRSTLLGLFLILIIEASASASAEARVSENCAAPLLKDSILGFHNHHSTCLAVSPAQVAVIEGDEVSLQKALQLVYSNRQDYIAVLFYASWCPFSRNFKPSFSVLSSLYPSVPHFAIEESAVRPSILSKYGVHGFPTLFLLNSTMRVRYRGSRSLSSLATFYSEVTGIKSDRGDQSYLEKFEGMLDNERNVSDESENCPFPWARSPENLLRQETYLALATIFVILRFLYFLSPYILEVARCTWNRYQQHVRIGTLWEHPLRYLNKAKQLFNYMKDPRKGSNFQEGAINARAWASKSLASAVAIGDPSTSRVATASGSN